MPKYTLTYFPTAGTACSIRLLFKLAGVEFTNVGIPWIEWTEAKQDEKRFPLGQMPVLDIDGHVICQSLAICRYLANEFGFYGDSNLDKLDIDQIVDTLVDHFAEICKIVFDKSLSDDEKKVGYEKLFTGASYLKRMYFITTILKQHCNGEKFFIGEKISLADVLFVAQDHMMAKINPAYLDTAPGELKALVNRIKDNDAIKKHLLVDSV